MNTFFDQKRALVFFLGLLPWFITEGVSQSTDSIRDQYIVRYTDHLFIWPVIKQRSLNFDVKNQVVRGQNLTFKPNNSVSMGLGMYVFDIGVELAFAVPINESSRMLYGTSDAHDLQANILSKKWGADLYRQKYTGFYVSDNRIKLGRNEIHPQRRDIVTRNFGLAGIYIFNDKKFSFKSAYNFAERQLYRKGSFLMTGSYNAFKLTADSAVIDAQNRLTFGPAATFHKLKYSTFSIAPGYTYSFIYNHFFLNATLLFGPAHNWIYYRLTNGAEKHDIAVNSYFSSRIALGYNSDRFFAGISFVNQSRNVVFESIEFTHSNNTFRLVVGYRFRESGVLKKSVWDLTKELMP